MIPAGVFAETLRGFLAPVLPYLDDPSVTEILINGPEHVHVERQGRLERTPVRFESCEAVLCALRNVAQFAGKRFDEFNPILEARLPDGSRLEALMSPVALDGPCVAIRRFSKDVMNADTLLQLGSLSELSLAALRAFVMLKRNILVAGGTGSGKTSLLNVLSGLADNDERTIVIEDSKEVQVPHPHVVYLEARPADAHGRGRVTIRELFRATLRMRPDRIVIGEIRGEEALDIIQAMVSGHGGCLGTLHATYPRDTLTRLETMAMMSELNMPLNALRLQIASGVNVIVQVSRLKDGSRVVSHITEVCGFDPVSQQYLLNDLFTRHSSSPDFAIALRPTGHAPQFLSEFAQHGVRLAPELQRLWGDVGAGSSLGEAPFATRGVDQ